MAPFGFLILMGQINVFCYGSLSVRGRSLSCGVKVLEGVYCPAYGLNEREVRAGGSFPLKER